MWAVIFVFAFVCAAAQDVNDVKNLPKYDKRYDYLDVDAILENKRLVKNYVDCLINVKPCTPEGKALKRILPEALRTKCIRCTESQKQTAVKIIRRLKTDYPEEWGKLASRWDPTGDFTRYFEEVFVKGNSNDSNSNEIPGSSPTASQPPVTPPPPTPSQPPLAPTSSSSSSSPQPPGSTSSQPVLLNRFGDDGSLMVNSPPPTRPSVTPSRPSVTPSRPSVTPGRPSVAPIRPSVFPVRPSSIRPVYTTRPTLMIWATAASDNIPTRFNLRPTKDFSPPYTTAITLIDQIGYKIIRTTELVTDILRNTVRAVMIGR